MTDEQRAVLAHVVLDPDAWYAHAVSSFGQEKGREALKAKVARWQASYDRAKTLPDYLPRAEREGHSEATE